MLTGYCAGWSLKQLIQEGLGGVPGKITLHAGQASGHAVQPDGQLPGHHAERMGGRAGVLLASTPISRRSCARTSCPTSEVKQCIESFVFGVNTPSRWGTQAPFSNITLDWTVPADLRESARHRRRQGAGLHLRRLPEGNGHGQQGVHRDHDRGRRQRPRLPVSRSPPTPSPRDFDWSGHGEQPSAVRDDQQIRHAVFLQLHQLRHGAQRRALDVLPPASGPARAAQESPAASSAAANRPVRSAS